MGERETLVNLAKGLRLAPGCCGVEERWHL